MKTVKIIVNNTTVFNEVNKLSSFVGKDLYNEKGESLYDIIKLKKQDAPFIDKYINEAVNRITGMVNEYLVTVNGNSGEIILSLPTSFPDYAYKELQEAISNYTINFVFSQWLYKHNIEQAKNYFELSDKNIIDAQEKLYTREKPTIPTHPTP